MEMLDRMEENKNNENSKNIILASEVLPDMISVLPISQRPIFPGMVLPVIISGEKLINTLREIEKTDEKIGGVVLSRLHQDAAHDGVVVSDDLYKVGVTVKIIKTNPIDENS